MVAAIIRLIMLFFVIFDPFMSFSVFFSITKDFPKRQKRKIAILAVTVAAGLSFAVLLFGKILLDIFSTDIQDFRVAGGIILLLLGIKMTLGSPSKDSEQGGSTGAAIAAVIGTPLITGPAAITAIILTSNDYGKILTGIAVALVLSITFIFLFFEDAIGKKLGTTLIQVMSTILGLITIAWGVDFIRTGLGI